jgi:hypothetical protein
VTAWELGLLLYVSHDDGGFVGIVVVIAAVAASAAVIMSPGNEPDEYAPTFNVSLSPAQHAADYQLFRGVLNSHGAAASSINGPAVATSLDPYMLQFDQALAALGNDATHVTFHHYYGAGPEFTVADFYSADVLDTLLDCLSPARSAALPLIECVG